MMRLCTETMIALGSFWITWSNFVRDWVTWAFQNADLACRNHRSGSSVQKSGSLTAILLTNSGVRGFWSAMRTMGTDLTRLVGTDHWMFVVGVTNITRLNESVTIYFKSKYLRSKRLILTHEYWIYLVWFSLAELLRFLEMENIVFHTTLNKKEKFKFMQHF